MHGITTWLAAGLALFSSGISASALPVDNHPLEKRANNGFYATNCAWSDGGGRGSYLMYYNNARSGSQNGQQPNDQAQIQTFASAFTTWEGSQKCGTFTSGTTGCTNISASAGGLAVGAYAGSGSNSWGATFSCYKDNGRILFQQTEGTHLVWTCRSIYYCFQN
ncbi:hypothetical protein V8F06_004313 [Rhypophila decipiens]